MRLSRGVAALLLVPALLATACSGGGETQAGPRPVAAPTLTTPPAPPQRPASIATVPANGATKVRPDAKVTVKVTDGELVDVRLTPAEGKALTGTVGADGTSWKLRGRLNHNSRYTLVATARGTDGVLARTTSKFRTLRASQILGIDVSPGRGETVGVGLPLVVTFDTPVTRKADVEQALQVSVSKPVTGAWHWISTTEAHYRPKSYWPAHSTVTLRAKLRGVNAGPGLWGAADRVVSYQIGRSMVSKINTDTHRLNVYLDGKYLRSIPVTAGQEPAYSTRSGIKVVLFKDPYRHMTGTGIGIPKDDPDYFDLDVYWTLAVTRSGEFLHAAPWSVGAQGFANVSHGCVGMSTTNGKWLYDHSMVGDVVDVTGTTKKMELTNGFGDWNLSWDEWLEGSALS